VTIIKIGHDQRSISNNNPSGLTAATCILKCLYKGYSKDQIINGKFNSDSQLVSIWIDFLRDKHWIEDEEKHDANSTDLKLTKKGKTWLKRFESASINIDK
jgi:predicted transcriptional regulator